MSPEKQRIAIAEKCGWRWITPSQMCGYAPWRKQYQGAKIPTDGSLPFDDLPRYLEDLNDMYEAECTLDDGQRAFYAIALSVICGTSLPYWLAHATAAQRAEAFLKTLGLWETE